MTKHSLVLFLPLTTTVVVIDNLPEFKHSGNYLITKYAEYYIWSS